MKQAENKKSLWQSSATFVLGPHTIVFIFFGWWLSLWVGEGSSWGGWMREDGVTNSWRGTKKGEQHLECK